MSNSPIRVAVIGAGRMAREHLRVLSVLPNVSVTGILGRSQARTRAVAKDFDISLVAEDIESLYLQSKPDLVICAVTEREVSEVLQKAIRFGVPILSEKPIGLDFSECEQICVQATESGCRIWVGLNRRSYGATRAVLSDLADAPGNRLIEVFDQEDIVAARNAGRDDDVIRNWMFANSIHMVDYITLFGRGEITNVQTIDAWKPNSPDLVTAKVQFASGDQAIYRAVWNRPGPWACAVTTISKRWEMRPLEKANVQNMGVRTIVDMPVDQNDTDYKPGFFVQLEDVIQAVRERAETKHVPTIQTATATTRLVARIYGLL